MENENIKCCDDNYNSGSCHDRKKISGCGACGGGIYGLAFVGSLVFYIQHSETFWMGVLGVLKAIVWPAILVYKILELLVK